MTKGNLDKYRDDYIVRTDQTCLKNTVKCIAYGAVLGTGIGHMDKFNRERGKTWMERNGRMLGRYTLPYAFLGGMFASTTCLMDEYRGRDKPVSNGFIGGAVAGAALGTSFHNPGKVLSYALFFGLAGAVVRLSIVNMFVKYDPEEHYDQLHKTLAMGEVRHLAPPTK